MYRCLCVCRLEVDMSCSILLQLIFWKCFSGNPELSVSARLAGQQGLWSCLSSSLYSIPLPPHHAGIMNMHLDSYMFTRYLNSGPHALVESTLRAEPSVKTQRRLLIIKKAKVDIHQSLSYLLQCLCSETINILSMVAKKEKMRWGSNYIRVSNFSEVGTIPSS